MTRKPTTPKRRIVAPPRGDDWFALSLKLPGDLVAQIDALAAAEERSRAKMIERLLRGALERVRETA